MHWRILRAANGAGVALGSLAIRNEKTIWVVLRFRRLMQGVGYPGYEAHKKAHDAFKYQLKEMKRQMRAGDIVLRSQLLSTMKNWLEDHITVVDRRFGEFYTHRPS